MSERIAPFTKIVFGSGDIGLSLTGAIVSIYFAIFLTDMVGIAPAVAAAAIFIGRSWDYVNDPMIGYLSDRTRTRWGRRRPFLLFGAIPFGLAFTLMWWKPPFAGLALVVYYAAVYLLFDTAGTFVYMPYYALTPELTSDYDERTSLTTYRMFFSIAASLVAFTLPPLIVGEFQPGNSHRILANGALFGAVSAVPLLLVFFAVREKREHAEAEQPRLLASLRAAVKNKAFLFGLGIFLFTWVTMDVLLTSLMYFITWCVRRQDQSYLIMGAMFVTAILTLPLWNRLSRVLGKRMAYIIGVSFWAAVQLVLILLGPESTLAELVVLGVLAGIGIGAAHVLPWSILPDAVEWDEWKTGERHEGTFYSLVTLCQKIASSVAIPLVLLVLGAFGYVGTASEQPSSALFAIRIVTGPIPAVLLGMGILCAALYPIDRKLHERILKELEERAETRGRK